MWTALAAIGTLSLAGFTAWLAWSTRGLAKSSQLDQEAQWRPVILPAEYAAQEPSLGSLRLNVRQ